MAQNLIHVLAESAGQEEMEHFQMAIEEALRGVKELQEFVAA